MRDRNYLEVGSEVHIDIYDDRLEIYSPGGMCDGINVQDRDIMLVPSRRRNPVIADVFQRLNYMERRGSGFKKIIDDYKAQYNYSDELAPVFKSQYDSFFLTLRNLNYSNGYKKNSINDRLNDVLNDGLNQGELELLTLITKASGATQNWYSEKTGFSIAKVQRIMKKLQENGIIYRYGSKKKGLWKVKGVGKVDGQPRENN